MKLKSRMGESGMHGHRRTIPIPALIKAWAFKKWMVPYPTARSELGRAKEVWDGDACHASRN
jgi:hypothetical protein